MTKYNFKLNAVGTCISVSLLTSGILLSATAQAAISQAPLSLTDGVAPNMILSLDESGSMSWSFVPDASHDVYKNKINSYNSRRMRAVNANPMAYDPGTIYEIPPAFRTNGTEFKLTTTFTDAPLNGFWIPSERSNHPGQGKQDLRTNYRLAREHRLGNTGDNGTRNWAAHPTDFDCTVEIKSNNSTADCGGTESKQVLFKITRTANTTCTAKIVLDDAGSTATVNSCSRSSTNNYRVNLTANTNGVPAYYYEFDPTMDGGKCKGKKGSTDEGGENCHRIKFVNANSAYDGEGKPLRHADGTVVDGRENFAIWYSFYRSRALATLSAASIAFYDLSNNVRFTWQNLDTCTSFTNTTSGSGNCGDNRIKTYSSTHRGEFYSWLRRIYFNKGTPLLATMERAGEYLKTETPWQKYPHGIGGKNTTENTYSCRPSYHVLMTDGMWNVARTIGTTARSDEASFDTPSGPVYGTKHYDKKPPFHDSTKNTLSDYAMHYWATDLRPELDNKITPYVPYKNSDKDREYWDPRNNPAEWQHMSNFIMGLGLSNALSSVEWDGSTHSGPGYDALSEGSVAWPAPASNSQNNVYDLWHAAINSRGEFYSVDSPQAMVQAFKDILNRIASRKSTASAPAISNSLESDGDKDDPQDRLITYSYQSSYDNTEDWIGDLKKVKSYREWISDGKGGGHFENRTEEVWSARSQLKNPRTVKMAGNGSDGFTSDASTNLKEKLNINPESGVTDNRWAERFAYIRGDQSKEGDDSTDFRKRSYLLGDFLASQPAVVQRPLYLKLFADRLEGGNKYSSFYEAIKDRDGRIYIGGNDGMLHAFDTSTGAEKLAFIPTAVFPNLNKLTGKNYSHHYYVDGSPQVADVYDHDSGQWKTILVGTLRAGGKGLFALDVTTPGKEKLLWEFDEFNYTSKEGYRNGMVGPGYSFPQPSIARLHNGRWAVVTGNGYEGANTNNGRAALYIIDAITGKLTKSLEVASKTIAANGLSTPRLADYDGDGVADYAYAGDLHGNLWRFDLLGAGAYSERDLTNGSIYGDKNSNADDFKVSYAGSPMFTSSVTVNSSTHAQPITAAPSLTRHPSGKGSLVIFGTGKYFEDADKSGTESHPQTLYAIWDQSTKAEDTNGTVMPISRAALVEQTIEETNLTAKGKNSGIERIARKLSDNTVSYYDDKGNVSKKGWYLNLAANGSYEGEMLIENMRVVGDTLLISTLVPNDDPCAHGAGNWLYALNPATGGRTLHHVFDTRIKNPDGTETIVSGLKMGNEGGIPISQTETGFWVDDEKLTPLPTGRLRGHRVGEAIDEETRGDKGAGAGSWRMIPNP